MIRKKYSLKQQQVDLIRLLIDPNNFKTQSNPVMADWLKTIPTERLALVAKISFNKRINKIRSVFPATFECFENLEQEVTLAFAAESIQTNISKIENAEMFLKFFKKWVTNPKNTKFLPLRDLAKLEFAIWKVSRHTASSFRSIDETEITKFAAENKFQISSNIELIESDFNVQVLINATANGQPLTKGNYYFIVFFSTESTAPQLLEIAKEIYTWLSETQISARAYTTTVLSIGELKQLYALNIIETIG